MPRYYFHLRAGEAIHRDVEGHSLPTVGGAYGHALDMAKQIMRDGPEEAQHWSLQVEDEGAETTFEVSFFDVAARFGSRRSYRASDAAADDAQGAE
jgi:hypothetical protein